MTAAAVLVNFDPLLDKSYRQTAMGHDVAAFLAWLELGGAAERTLDQYERDLAKGALLYPSKSMSDLQDGDAFQIAKSYRPGERRVRIAAWRSFFKWGRQARRVTVNPFDSLPTIKRAPQRVYDIFTDAEIAMLYGLPSRDRVLMAILIDEGLRKAEARDFQLRQFRPDPSESAPWGNIVVLGKGSKERRLRATKRVSSWLAEAHLTEGLSNDDHLWYATPANDVWRGITRSKPIGDGTFARWWRRCLDEAGVRYRNPHMTRHTFATNWLRRAGRLERLSMAMGHASIRTTFDLYGHLDSGDVAEDLALVESVYKGEN